MRDGIIYDCPHANCRTPIDTGKCSKACIERYSKEMGKKPMTNADRIRASDDELEAMLLAVKLGYVPWCDGHCESEGEDGCDNCIKEWLRQPTEET